MGEEEQKMGDEGAEGAEETEDLSLDQSPIQIRNFIRELNTVRQQDTSIHPGSSSIHGYTTVDM
eukprot:m.220954 g.220954  ORF g.220954 m.220954 type:complete len:64 (+) comp39951_c2_seq28:241-432(+)